MQAGRHDYSHCANCAITRCETHSESILCDNCIIQRLCDGCRQKCKCGLQFKARKNLKQHVRYYKKLGITAKGSPFFFILSNFINSIFRSGKKTLDKSQILKALTFDCCKRTCMKNLCYSFIEQMRSHWAGYNEVQKKEEIKKIVEALQVKEKTETSSTICISISSSLFLIL